MPITLVKWLSGELLNSELSCSQPHAIGNWKLEGHSVCSVVSTKVTTVKTPMYDSNVDPRFETLQVNPFVIAPIGWIYLFLPFSSFNYYCPYRFSIFSTLWTTVFENRCSGGARTNTIFFEYTTPEEGSKRFCEWNRMSNIQCYCSVKLFNFIIRKQD